MWIFFTLMAAACQTVRTGFQKQLTQSLTPDVITWSRAVFGLPFVGLYAGILYVYHPVFPTFSWHYLSLIGIAAMAQLLATKWMVMLFARRSFIVGVLYAKTEGFLTALIGVALFQDWLTVSGWISVCLSVAGVLCLQLKPGSLSRFSESLSDRHWMLGLGSGLAFATTAVCVRQASLLLNVPSLYSAAWTLLIVVALQTLVLGVWLYWQYPERIYALKGYMKLAWGVGFFGVMGSVGWFTGFALTQAAYVKTLGQVELLFSMIVTRRVFNEDLSRMEWVGLGLLVFGIVLLVI